jgi:hypothetical protein
MTAQTNRPTEGDFAYVKPGFEGVQEAEVIAAGERYEVRLLASGTTRTVPSSAVWSATPSSGYDVTPIHDEHNHDSDR